MPITQKVQIFFPAQKFSEYADIIVYVYYDDQREVEDYYVGGS